MRSNRLVTIAVVSMLMIGGVAAVGAASPAPQAADNAKAAGAADNGQAPDTDAAADANDGAGGADEAGPANGSEMAADRGGQAGNAPSVGPPGGLPSQVPDHVHQIHDTIDSYLGGSIDHLGHALSDLLGGENAADTGAQDAGQVNQDESEDADDGDDDSDRTDDDADDA